MVAASRDRWQHGTQHAALLAVHLAVSRPLPVEPYAANRVTGAFVLIDGARTTRSGMVAA